MACRWGHGLALMCLMWVLLLPRCVFAHNGVVACAYPVSEIVTDGDLSDWPKDAISFLPLHIGYSVATLE